MLEKQLTIIKEQAYSCAFTGHRELTEDFSLKLLQKTVKELVKNGVKTFFCGMALGFDLAAAEAVLKVKKKNADVRLIACIPCLEQDKYYPAAEKKRYQKLLNKADEKTILSPVYTRACMLIRDRYMADNADALVAFLRKETGGPAYTVKYFTKKYPFKEVIFL